MITGRGLKLYNQYQEDYPNYDKTPKAVIAAVALSLARHLYDDNLEDVQYALLLEWKSLYEAGIVPQKPSKKKES